MITTAFPFSLNWIARICEGTKKASAGTGAGRYVLTDRRKDTTEAHRAKPVASTSKQHMGRLSDMADAEKLKDIMNSLSPEMRRLCGLPSKKRGRKKDLDIPSRFMEMVRLRRRGATWPEIEKAMVKQFRLLAEGTYRKQYERELRKCRDFASKECDEEFLAILARMRRKPGRPPKKNPDKIPA